MKKEIKVVITGAAGQIGYSLIPRLVDGNTFGDKIVNLTLVEIPQVVSKLEGLAMELDDSYFPKLGSINFTDNFAEAAVDADWFLLVGSIPRGIVYNGKKIEERSDLLQINGSIFVEQGKAIGEFGNENAKILVVGNPANTNALIGRSAANNTSQTWMAMTMLDANRAKSMLSKKLSCNVSEVKNMIIWGNHSPTMYPDYENALVNNQSISELIDDEDWINSSFIPSVQQRGKAVIDARGASSATSAAKAALDTIKACENETESGNCFSAALFSDGAYDVPEGIMCGFPLMTTSNGKIEIVRDLTLSEKAKSRLDLSVEELLSEKESIKDLLEE
tara:strand:- start:81 stop:1082 length:1002 start_codon:yes stop_codon:yes gene_type:complete